MTNTLFNVNVYDDGKKEKAIIQNSIHLVA